MALDPKARALLNTMEAVEKAPLHLQTVETARRDSITQLLNMSSRLPLIRNVENRNIPGPDVEIPIRVYTPEIQKPLPLLLFFHGGGFVVCNLDTHDWLCRELCFGAECIVVSVDYRLAPEWKFPAATRDCFAATCWAAQHAVEIGADPARIVISGDSAGGNLAAITALRARDENGPSLRGQLLFYPVTDHYTADTASYKENAEGYGLTRDQMVWFWDHYLAAEADAVHPYASPLRAPDLKGLPPAMIVTAEYDPLRDEGIAYANRLVEAGVVVTHSHFEGMIHGFVTYGNALDQTRQAIRKACTWLRETF